MVSCKENTLADEYVLFPWDLLKRLHDDRVVENGH